MARKYLLFGSVLLLAGFPLLESSFALPEDKAFHLRISFLLFALIFSARLTFRQHISELVALLLALRDVVFIGLFKELLDGTLNTGNPELADLVANLIGISIPFLGLILIEFFGVGCAAFVHDFTKKIHPSLQHILKSEKNYFSRQLAFVQHAGIKLLYQI